MIGGASCSTLPVDVALLPPRRTRFCETWRMTNRVIALDADGVLLDYGLAYATAWPKAFGVYPRERDAKAYWPIDRRLLRLHPR